MILAAITIEQLTGALGTAGVLGGALALVRSSRIQSTLDTLGRANDELRKVVDDEKKAREADRHACERELGTMRGQLTVLTADFGRDIARAIVAEFSVRPDIARRRAHRQGDQP